MRSRSTGGRAPGPPEPRAVAVVARSRAAPPRSSRASGARASSAVAPASVRSSRTRRALRRRRRRRPAARCIRRAAPADEDAEHAVGHADGGERDEDRRRRASATPPRTAARLGSQVKMTAPMTAPAQDSAPPTMIIVSAVTTRWKPIVSGETVGAQQAVHAAGRAPRAPLTTKTRRRIRLTSMPTRPRSCGVLADGVDPAPEATPRSSRRPGRGPPRQRDDHDVRGRQRAQGAEEAGRPAGELAAVDDHDADDEDEGDRRHAQVEARQPGDQQRQQVAGHDRR